MTIINKNMKKFACKFADCTQSFDGNWKLKQHEHIHLNLKPFSCFKLPATKKEQEAKNIEDERDPSEFVETIKELETRLLDSAAADDDAGGGGGLD